MRRGSRIAGLAALLVLGAASPAAALDVWAVGDGADDGSNDDALSTYIQSRAPGRVFYLGDVYGNSTAPDGTLQSFKLYYDPSFGRFKSITNPTPGNHEFPGHAQGYDPYWGPLAPQTGGGHYYSFDAGGWHFVSLNSEEAIGEGSAQLTWLRSDLAAHPSDCTIAFDHKPRFTQGYFNGAYTTQLAPMWAALSGHAVALISAHDHNYQRFVPVDGVTQFVVGTGGHGLAAVNSASSLAKYSDTVYGALHMTVASGSIDYEFVGLDGARIDSGALTCTPPSGPPPPPPAPPPPPPPGQQPPPGGGSGGQPGGNPARHDRDPLVLISRPRTGTVYRVGPRVFAGNASNVSGPVLVSLTRRIGRSCRALGRLGWRYSCAKPPRFAAAGVARWTLRLPRGTRLPSGRFRVSAAAGNVSDAVTFRVR